MTTTTLKKPTLATVKSFINKNREHLYINVKSDFDGMTDCIEKRTDGFQPATHDKTVSIDSSYYEATLGINGAWFVRGSRDYITPFENDTLTGFEVSNCCGSFVLAITKN